MQHAFLGHHDHVMSSVIPLIVWRGIKGEGREEREFLPAFQFYDDLIERNSVPRDYSRDFGFLAGSSAGASVASAKTDFLAQLTTLNVGTLMRPNERFGWS